LTKTVKNTLLFVSVVGIMTPVLGQIATKPLALPKLDRKLLYFGFHIGVNTMNFAVRPMDNPGVVDSVYAIEPTPQSGFSLGLMTNLRLTDVLCVRFTPGLSFGQRTLNYTMRGVNDTDFYNVAKPVESTYLDFPIALRLKSARLNDFRVYVDAGMKYTYDLASKQNIDDKGASFVKIKKNDISFEMGTGLDIYLRYFKFSPAVKVSWGIPNMLVREDHAFSSSLSRLHTRAVMFTFFFEGSL
jgi:hypothetical protein